MKVNGVRKNDSDGRRWKERTWKNVESSLKEIGKDHDREWKRKAGTWIEAELEKKKGSKKG